VLAVTVGIRDSVGQTEGCGLTLSARARAAVGGRRRVRQQRVRRHHQVLGRVEARVAGVVGLLLRMVQPPVRQDEAALHGARAAAARVEPAEPARQRIV
jgi:hypothetical protein